MIRLVTQYNKIESEYARGWDGASGPYFCHIIDDENNGSSLAEGVGINGHTEIEIDEWLDERCLTNFRLEISYE